MTGNLKALLLAALAVTAFSAVTASAASAGTFTAPGAGPTDVTTLTTVKDGTGKTAHQVFDIRKLDGSGVLSITCEAISGHSATTGDRATSLTFETPAFEGNCSFAGQSVTVQNTGCSFEFTPTSPQLHIVNDTSTVCAHGQKPIHFTNTILNCKVEVGAQTISGIKYHNLADGTVTVEAKELTVKYNATGAGCNYGTLENGLFTTGNAIVKGERGGKAVEIKVDS